MQILQKPQFFINNVFKMSVNVFNNFDRVHFYDDYHQLK